MIPIHELLNRIRWDKHFGDATFRIGYYDRVEHDIVLVELAEARFPADDHSLFEWTDPEGETHSVPLHRIKQVYRNGELIWQRSH